MPKQKACKKCRTVYKGAKCPRCGSEESTDTFKGKIFVLNPEESEIAKKIKLNEKGEYAIKT
ncbi:MAG: DNA-directed RNA polymerase subunit E'' [Nanoarchaeota archaeon]|nr:DNA-directed RNA polymerase subunit E'' [Nanoarchaeota archaeon]MBU1103853.1 DNA-directed RNA polymerase subunit E'' [Nanoarchaeota archaeon]